MKKILLCSLTASLLFAQTELENKGIINVPFKGTLISGYDFTPDNNFRGNSLVFHDENNCKYLGNATYSLVHEKALVSLYKQSCVVNGKVIDSNIKGFVFEDQRSGLLTQTKYSSNSVVAHLEPNKNVELVVTRIDLNNK